MGVRKFWLQQGEDDTNIYSFLSDSFLNEPQGLGFSKTISTLKIGNREIVQDEYYNLPTISGTITFYKGDVSTKYKDYQDFLNFIRNGDIRLYYNTPNTFDSYYCEGRIIAVDKGEVGTNGVMECPFSFKATTQWQNAKQRIVTTIKSQTDGGKFYDLERDYYYSPSSFDTIELINRGYEQVGFELLIEGEVTNPKLTLSQNGVVYGALQINGTYDRVYINSKDGEEEIILERNGSIVPNPISYQDMSIADGVIDVTFLKLKTGTSTASFSPNEYDGEVSISWYDAYMSV